MVLLAFNFSLIFFLINHLTLLTTVKVVFMTLWLALLGKLFSTSSHVLMVLLTLEVLMLFSVLLFALSSINFFSNSELLMVFFTLAVCEASLGLGLLIQLARKTGSDLLTVL